MTFKDFFNSYIATPFQKIAGPVKKLIFINFAAETFIAFAARTFFGGVSSLEYSLDPGFNLPENANSTVSDAAQSAIDTAPYILYPALIIATGTFISVSILRGHSLYNLFFGKKDQKALYVLSGDCTAEQIYKALASTKGDAIVLTGNDDEASVYFIDAKARAHKTKPILLQLNDAQKAEIREQKQNARMAYPTDEAPALNQLIQHAHSERKRIHASTISAERRAIASGAALAVKFITLLYLPVTGMLD